MTPWVLHDLLRRFTRSSKKIFSSSSDPVITDCWKLSWGHLPKAAHLPRKQNRLVWRSRYTCMCPHMIPCGSPCGKSNALVSDRCADATCVNSSGYDLESRAPRCRAARREAAGFWQQNGNEKAAEENINIRAAIVRRYAWEPCRHDNLHWIVVFEGVCFCSFLTTAHIYMYIIECNLQSKGSGLAPTTFLFV